MSSFSTIRVSTREKKLKKDVPRSEMFDAKWNSREESLSCQVCLAPFSVHIQSNIPRILTSCGHTLCHNCAVTIQKMSINQLSIACPFDRIVTRMLAAKLPRNFAIIDLIGERGDVAELTPRMRSTEIHDDPIYPCYENPKHESTKYCRICDVDFCDSCFLSVHSSKILSTHQSYSVNHRLFRLPKCSMHSNNLVFYYCTDKKCKASSPLCCNTCMQSLHENHSTVPIEKRAEENERELKKILETLNSKEEKMSESLQQAQKNVESLNKSGAEYQGMVTKIKMNFEEKTVKSIRRLNGLLDSKRDGLVKVEKDVQSDLDRIKETKKDIEKMLKKKDVSLFTQDIFKKGEAMCKEANVVPFSMPTLREIVNPTPKLAKPPKTARQFLNGSLFKNWLGSK